MLVHGVIPAEAEIHGAAARRWTTGAEVRQGPSPCARSVDNWFPAFAGMTLRVGLVSDDFKARDTWQFLQARQTRQPPDWRATAVLKGATALP